MSARSTNSSTFGRAMHPSQDERLPSLTNSGATTDGDTTDHEIEDEAEFKNAMKLLWAERENIDLKLKLHKIAVENRGLRAKVTGLEANATAASDTAELLKKHDELVKAIEEKQLVLGMQQLSLQSVEEAEEAKKEASRTRIEMQRLQGVNEKLQLELDKVKFSRANDANQAQSRVLELQAANTALEAKNEQLTTSLEAVKKNTADLVFYRAKNENNERELKALREKVTDAETARDWHRSEHTKIPEVRNALNAERGRESAQVGRLRGDIANLRTEKKDLENQRRTWKLNLAKYITELDLADANLRVFTCSHNALSSIPDDKNATREKSASLIATDIFKDWVIDAESMEEYNYERQYFLSHHRAHEAVNQGRGDPSWKLKNELVRIDSRRGVDITYS